MSRRFILTHRTDLQRLLHNTALHAVEEYVERLRAIAIAHGSTTAIAIAQMRRRLNAIMALRQNFDEEDD